MAPHGIGIIGGGRISGGGRDGEVVVVSVIGALGVELGDPPTAAKIASIDNRKPIAATSTNITLALGTLRSAMTTSIALSGPLRQGPWALIRPDTVWL